MKEFKASKGQLVVDLPNEILAFLDGLGEGSRATKVRRLLREAAIKSGERIDGKEKQN